MNHYIIIELSQQYNNNYTHQEVSSEEVWQATHMNEVVNIKERILSYEM